MTSKRSASREGKRSMCIWMEPSLWREVSLIAIDRGVPKETVLLEAVEAAVKASLRDSMARRVPDELY
jgi:hypothetical protein